MNVLKGRVVVDVYLTTCPSAQGGGISFVPVQLARSQPSQTSAVPSK